MYLRDIVAGKKKVIAKIKLILVEHEYPNRKSEMMKKYFILKLLMASDWLKDVANTTLMKISEMCSKRK